MNSFLEGYMRIAGLLLVLIAALLGSVTGAQAVLNGTTYAVVAPVYDGSNGSTSFLRLYGGFVSATSSFSVQIVNATNGANLGNAVTINVPKNASPQFAFGTLLGMAGAAQTTDHNYALYIRNTEATSGYQHVTFNGTSGLFENVSVCPRPLNEAALASSVSLVATNLHTDQLGADYPSQIDIHNYWNAAVTYGVYVYDAGTADGTTGAIRAGSGAAMGSKLYTIPANSTLSLAFTQIQQAINWATNNNQLHANIIVTEASNQAPTETLTTTVITKRYGGAVNMSLACAVNPAPVSSGGGGTIGGGDSGAYLN
jgi:hypothetical protein